MMAASACRVCLLFTFCVLLALPKLSAAADEPAQAAASDPYPLGLTLRQLERDLTSKDYAIVLETMIPTDLEAEWKRVATADVTATHIAWQLPRGGPHVPSPAYYDGRLYLVNDTGIATCLAAQTGETIWQTRLPGRFSMSPIEAGGKLLVTSETGTTFVLQAGAEYKLLATNELGEDTLATPAVLGGRIYFRTKGQLVCVGSGVAGR